MATESSLMDTILEAIHKERDAIESWLDSYEAYEELPLYSSVDIRDAGFKQSVVDTNLFPAGFNNLCEHGEADSVEAFRKVIGERIRGCRKILVLAEQHTRNPWYLEHLRVLQGILERAGFQTVLATFLDVDQEVGWPVASIELETAQGHTVKIHSVRRVVKDIEAGGIRPCFIVLNNDLTTGIPEVLKETNTPIYPSIQAGWHARNKSHHFQLTNELMQGFSSLIGVDPWFFSCLFDVQDDIDVHEAATRQRLADAASDLMQRIQCKYDEHGIDEKPFIFVKADRGTYGMGVLPIEDPQQLIELGNRKRNKLYKGKGSQVISRYLLQEGVPSSHRVADKVGEVCLYQVANQFVGGFYRTHGEKGSRESLNSQGMEFHRMCPHQHDDEGQAIVPDLKRFELYRILGRIAGIAAHREIRVLEHLAA